MNFKVEGIEELNAGITELAKYAKSPLVSYRTSAVLLYKDIQDHFKREMGEDGKWERFLYKGKRVDVRPTKRGGNKLLQDTGKLRASISHISTKEGAEVGTNLKSGTVFYPAILNNGNEKKNLVARPFMWASEMTMNKILDVFVDDMENV